MGHARLGWVEEYGRLLAANDTPPYPTMRLSERVGAPGFVGLYTLRTLRNCSTGYFGSGAGMPAWSGGGRVLVSCQVSSRVLI